MSISNHILYYYIANTNQISDKNMKTNYRPEASSEGTQAQMGVLNLAAIYDAMGRIHAHIGKFKLVPRLLPTCSVPNFGTVAHLFLLSKLESPIEKFAAGQSYISENSTDYRLAILIGMSGGCNRDPGACEKKARRLLLTGTLLPSIDRVDEDPCEICESSLTTLFF
ncbi:hypothetical protein ACJX0J_024424 [Zea mays]